MATTIPPLLLPLLLLLLALCSHPHVAASRNATAATAGNASPFAARAAAIRYWNRKVPNHRPHPSFFLSKFSPLSALDTAAFSSLAAAAPDAAALSPRVPALCATARLLCTSEGLSTASLAARHHHHHHSVHSPSGFAAYQNSNFSNYGRAVDGGLDSFKNYSDGLNVPIDTFRRYSRRSAGHDDSFANYAPDGNVVTANFTSYAGAAAAGADGFQNYDAGSNAPDLGFASYDAEANGRRQSFAGYSDGANAGDESFSGYGKHGNGVATPFTGYGNNSNVIGSGFANYGVDGNGANDTFTSYGDNGNVPENTFRNYGPGGNGGAEKFSSYRDQANVGDDSFSSYAKGGNAATAIFVNYGNSFNEGSDTFKGYGQDSSKHKIKFTTYAGDNTTFKGYAKSGVEFKDYRNSSSSSPSNAASTAGVAEKAAKRAASNWVVEPGKFFRERELRKGTVMPMPDIRDRMPPRAFLPRSIAGRIPLAAGAVSRIFGIPAGSALGKKVAEAVADCERPPSRGETKRCAASAEDVIDFAVQVLGPDVVVRSTESAVGSKGNILIGDVRGVSGGNITESVSCHQSLFPYLVYYCHSVPKVRVYEAEILSVRTKEKINRGVAICHLDTSDWSAGHGAFVALGPGPGKIEVCHWIFQGDMTWTAAD